MKDTMNKLFNRCADGNIESFDIAEPLDEREVKAIMKKFNESGNIKKSYGNKKRIAAVMAAAATVSVLGVTAAAESGFFPSLQRIFHTDNPNVPIETEFNDYAFVPDIEPVIADGVTINFTEALADNHTVVLCFDVVCDDRIIEQIPEEAYHGDTAYVGFNWFHLGGAGESLRLERHDGNTLSMYVRSSGHWYWDETSTLNIRDFGYTDYSDITEEPVFVSLCKIDEDIIIPNETIKRCESKKAYSEINGISYEMELSKFGFTLVGATDRGYQMLNRGEYACKDEEFKMYMTDGRVFDGSKDRSIINTRTYHYTEDSYCEYAGFGMPMDIEQIEKIELSGNEFVFK